MRIVLIQTRQNALYDFEHPEKKWTISEAVRLSREMVTETLEMMERVRDADLMVTTEAVNYPGSAETLHGGDGQRKVLRETEAAARFSAFAKERKCYVAAGLYTLSQDGIRNTCTVFDRQGEVCAGYEKVHLAGEEQRTLVPGDRYVVWDSEFGRIGLSVCWDMQFPEVARHYALSACTLVVCPTWGWEKLYAQARAYENGIHVAAAMAVPYRGPITGIRAPSQVIAPDGRILACGRTDGEDLVEAELDLHREWEEHRIRMHDRRSDTYGKLVSKCL